MNNCRQPCSATRFLSFPERNYFHIYAYPLVELQIYETKNSPLSILTFLRIYTPIYLRAIILIAAPKKI
ncbi:MAG: hypothetical protein JWQ38_739 [Flavipsychrobacter sp.]|nr:hypothetical protein [Flavipsychrobacter sp.]